MAAQQAPPFLGFSRQELWSGLPFPSPMHGSEKWKWSHSVVSDFSRPHGLQPTRLLRPWDVPGKSTGVGCHCLLPTNSSLMSFWLLSEVRSPHPWSSLTILDAIIFNAFCSHGQRSLVGYSPWGREEADTTERLHFHFSLSCTEKEMATHSSILA